jgi:hypothetical protein
MVWRLPGLAHQDPIEPGILNRAHILVGCNFCFHACNDQIEKRIAAGELSFEAGSKLLWMHRLFLI